MINEIILSPYLITIFLAWLGSHIIKYSIDRLDKQKRKLRSDLFASGGMPSSHSATVVSVATIIGLRDGFGSGLFGLAVIFSLIVMYDAMNVRRSVGEQGFLLYELIKEQKSRIKPIRIIEGHTPTEVAAGCLLGIIVGLAVFFATI